MSIMVYKAWFPYDGKKSLGKVFKLDKTFEIFEITKIMLHDSWWAEKKYDSRKKNINMLNQK